MSGDSSRNKSIILFSTLGADNSDYHSDTENNDEKLECPGKERNEENNGDLNETVMTVVDVNDWLSTALSREGSVLETRDVVVDFPPKVVVQRLPSITDEVYSSLREETVGDSSCDDKEPMVKISDSVLKEVSSSVEGHSEPDSVIEDIPETQEANDINDHNLVQSSVSSVLNEGNNNEYPLEEEMASNIRKDPEIDNNNNDFQSILPLHSDSIIATQKRASPPRSEGNVEIENEYPQEDDIELTPPIEESETEAHVPDTGSKKNHHDKCQTEKEQASEIQESTNGVIEELNIENEENAQNRVSPSSVPETHAGRRNLGTRSSVVRGSKGQ